MTSTEQTQGAELTEAISSEDLYEIHNLLKRALSHFEPGKLATKARRTGRASALASLDAVMKFTDEDWEMVLAHCPDYADRLRKVLVTAHPDKMAETIRGMVFKVGELLPRVEQQPDGTWVCYCPDMYSQAPFKADAVAEWKRMGGKERVHQGQRHSIVVSHGQPEEILTALKKEQRINHNILVAEPSVRKPGVRFTQVRPQSPTPDHWLTVNGKGQVIASRTDWMYPNSNDNEAGTRDDARYRALAGRDGSIVIGQLKGAYDVDDLLTMLSWRGPPIAVDWYAVNNEIKSFVEDYEFDTGEGYYKLNLGERIMMEDAIHGILDGDNLLKHLQRPNHMDKVMQFLDAAAGEGLELGGVDAGELFVLLFPEEHKRRSQDEGAAADAIDCKGQPQDSV